MQIQEGHTLFALAHIIYIPHQKLLCASTTIVSTAIHAVNHTTED